MRYCRNKICPDKQTNGQTNAADGQRENMSGGNDIKCYENQFKLINSNTISICHCTKKLHIFASYASDQSRVYGYTKTDTYQMNHNIVLFSGHSSQLRIKMPTMNKKYNDNRRQIHTQELLFLSEGVLCQPECGSQAR